MPTARELLEQADALMRRNRARQVDTEIPELTDVIAMPVIAPEPSPEQPTSPAPPVALADIPELTDAVEEIEIASIVDVPDDDLESNEWLRADDEELAAEIAARATSTPQASRVPEPIGGRVLPLFAVAGKAHESAIAAPAPAPMSESNPIVTAVPQSTLAKASVVELPVRDASPAHGDNAEFAANQPTPASADTEASATTAPTAQTGDRTAADVPAKDLTGTADEWARWEALAEEIRMQVLQRIDIFTDTGLREQLSVQMRPIVERASAEMVATINAQVGTLLRAYIAEAIEREIDKWRAGTR